MENKKWKGKEKNLVERNNNDNYRSSVDLSGNFEVVYW